MSLASPEPCQQHPPLAIFLYLPMLHNPAGFILPPPFPLSFAPSPQLDMCRLMKGVATAAARCVPGFTKAGSIQQEVILVASSSATYSQMLLQIFQFSQVSEWDDEGASGGRCMHPGAQRVQPAAAALCSQGGCSCSVHSWGRKWPGEAMRGSMMCRP